jgi:putative transferase (TIGR04331 family)
MPDAPRYLITTADERTWKFDRPVIFLGEWCRLYSRKHVWQSMDAIVAPPYGVSKEQKDADHAEARSLEEKLYPILCAALNQHHGTHHDMRFWRIAFGCWLRRYVDTILNRVRTLEQCLQAYKISGTAAISDEVYLLATMNSYAAIWAFDDSRWNGTLYVRILNLLGEKNCPVEMVVSDASEGFRWHTTATAYPLKRRILLWGYRQIGKLAGFLAKEKDAFIINSYLSKKEEIKLQLALGQVPQLWSSSQFEPTVKPDCELRRRLSNQIAGVTNDTLFGVICSLVFELLPVCYLEGFAELTEKVQQLPWPRRPKLIFTSNSFDTDETFKLWTATKTESGSQYIVGQHGNNYGTHRYLGNLTPDQLVADKFLTWGWADGLPQIIPAFIFKTAGRKAQSFSPDGGLLLIEFSLGHRLFSWDDASEFKAYFEDQKNFIRKLNKQIINHLIIRLHHIHTNSNFGEGAQWKEFDPTIKIDAGFSNIRSLIAQSRLVVHSYDSTGVLETLSGNIPTLVFWQNGFDHLRDDAIPYYQPLVDAGVVHLTHESVAAKVNEVWDDVGGWWMQADVQNARKQFCDRFGRMSQSPVCELKNILLSNPL